MIYIYYLIAAFLLFILAKSLHEAFNKGLSLSSRHQQGTRFAVASLMAAVPLALTGLPPAGPRFVIAAVTSITWMLTYPVLFHITNRNASPDYDNYMDTACGYYFFGALTAIAVAGQGAGHTGFLISGIILSVIEIALLLLCLSQIVYFALYRQCISNDGMALIQQTNVNEVIEFSHTYPVWMAIGTIGSIIALATGCILANFSEAWQQTGLPLWLSILEAVIFLALCFFIFHGKRCPFKRCGLIQLYLDIKDYSLSTGDYKEFQTQRVNRLHVEQLGKPWDRPTTIVMVIGESATRDFMSAFVKMEHDSTPWLRESAATDPAHFLIFPNTYSCAPYTVASLEKALTEFNQYNNKNFNDSCTVVDIAHALGYKVHWYSNQGHIGSFDSRVSMVAETSDVAKWTKQELNKVQYDMTLLDFVDEIDPTVNNLVVFHLKGSHFNFLNRYPEECTVWGRPGVQEDELNYLNSLHYTDSVLQRIFTVCRERLNMQAMVYFSDHGQIPSQRRRPGFDGFNMMRVPLFVWLSDTYIAHHPLPYKALVNNRLKYFTNDLAYNLMCGIMDIKSNCYDESDSIASPSYRHTPETLTTNEGKIRICDDPILKKQG